MAIDLNADVGQIFKQLMGGGTKENNASASGTSLYKDAVLKVVIILCVLVSVTYGITTITSDPIQKDDSEFATNDQLKEALGNLESNIASSRSIFNSNKNKVKQILPEFTAAGDLKNLFKLISSLARENSLIIKNISKGVENNVNNPIRYIRNTVFLEIEGFYPNYINFKEQLLTNKNILSIDSEKIKLKKDRYGERSLNINMIISDFSIEKEGYEQLLNKDL